MLLIINWFSFCGYLDHLSSVTIKKKNNIEIFLLSLQCNYSTRDSQHPRQNINNVSLLHQLPPDGNRIDSSEVMSGHHRQWKGNGLSARSLRKSTISRWWTEKRQDISRAGCFQKRWGFFWNRGGLCGLVMTKSIDHQQPLASIVLVCFHGSLASSSAPGMSQLRRHLWLCSVHHYLAFLLDISSRTRYNADISPISSRYQALAHALRQIINTIWMISTIINTDLWEGLLHQCKTVREDAVRNGK